VIEEKFKATGVTYAIQDGAGAGQTVKHVHVHILPRFKGDFDENDEIYRAVRMISHLFFNIFFFFKLEKSDKAQPRTDQQMADEAKELAKLFE